MERPGDWITSRPILHPPLLKVGIIQRDLGGLHFTDSRGCAAAFMAATILVRSIFADVVIRTSEKTPQSSKNRPIPAVRLPNQWQPI